MIVLGIEISCDETAAAVVDDGRRIYANLVLSQLGTLAPVIIHQRADFASSMISGRTVMEIRRKSRSAAEIAGLWEYLKDRLNTHVHQTNLTPPKGVA